VDDVPRGFIYRGASGFWYWHIPARFLDSVTQEGHLPRMSRLQAVEDLMSNWTRKAARIYLPIKADIP